MNRGQALAWALACVWTVAFLPLHARAEDSSGTPNPAPTANAPVSDHTWSNFSVREYHCKRDITAYDPKYPSQVIGVFKEGTDLEILKINRGRGLVLMRYAPAGGTPMDVVCRLAEVDIITWNKSEFTMNSADASEMAHIYGTYLGIRYILEWITPRYPALASKTAQLTTKLQTRFGPTASEFDRLLALQAPDVVAMIEGKKNEAYLKVRGILNEHSPPSREGLQTQFLPKLDQEADKIIAAGDQLRSRIHAQKTPPTP